jgi:hypothetical protein
LRRTFNASKFVSPRFQLGVTFVAANYFPGFFYASNVDLSLNYTAGP